MSSGPLAGVRLIELAGIGPGPFAATILADLGADVLRIDRPGPQLLAGGEEDLLASNRPSVEIDLKTAEGLAAVRELVRSADLFIEGLRPGVTERLGLGPADLAEINPTLVYGRMTGWGQDGPLAQTAGHDITYTALSGVLHGLGQSSERPQFPVNLLGDFGGGSTFLVIGLLAALHHAKATGHGQVVDAAILDGTAYLDLMTAGWRAGGRHTEARGTNLLDGGAPYYRLYRTSDARWMAVGALEPQFFEALVDILGLTDRMPPQDDTSRYDEMTVLLETALASRTMAEWTAVFEGTDACVAPVLTPSEAALHPHLAARSTYVEIDGVVQPAPAPRFSATPTSRTPGTRTPLLEAMSRWS